jgi:hypothetical protein
VSKRSGVVSEPFAPVQEYTVVLVDFGGDDGDHSQSSFDSLEVRTERVGAQIDQTEFVTPYGQNSLRSPKANTVIDNRASADRSALQDVDGKIPGRLGTLISIKAAVHVRFALIEIFGPVIGTLFEKSDGDAAFGELLGGDRTPSPGSHNHHFGLDAEQAPDLGSVYDVRMDAHDCNQGPGNPMAGQLASCA